MAAAADDPHSGLQETLQKTDAVTAEIQRASDHVAVIGTVLAQELPGEVQVGEVAQAIEQTEELEKKLAQSADTLADVSAALELEIAKRREVAKKLEASQDLVEKLTAQAQDAPTDGAGPGANGASSTKPPGAPAG